MVQSLAYRIFALQIAYIYHQHAKNNKFKSLTSLRNCFRGLIYLLLVEIVPSIRLRTSTGPINYNIYRSYCCTNTTHDSECNLMDDLQ